MKRVSVKIAAPLLEQARRELGASTYAATVNQALAELLRLRQVQRLSEFYGSHAWRGDLSEMREDKSPRPRVRRATGRSGR